MAEKEVTPQWVINDKKEAELIPKEVIDELEAGSKIIVYCWMCEQILYASEPRNITTEEVAECTIVGHEHSFSEFHDSRIFPDNTPEKIKH
jgi:hypothetical protein